MKTLFYADSPNGRLRLEIVEDDAVFYLYVMNRTKTPNIFCAYITAESLGFSYLKKAAHKYWVKKWGRIPWQVPGEEE